jgi:hypothetical protein
MIEQTEGNVVSTGGGEGSTAERLLAYVSHHGDHAGPLNEAYPEKSRYEWAQAAFKADIRALLTRLAQLEAAEAEPDAPGAFVGDIWFGDPVKRAFGTHRWDGNEWERLPTEEAALSLLADAHSRLAEAERRADAATTHERITRALANIAAAMEFIESEAENRAAAGSKMSDYEREPHEAAEQLGYAVQDLELLLRSSMSEER